MVFLKKVTLGNFVVFAVFRKTSKKYPKMLIFFCFVSG